MEELRETALAYYANLSENQKREAVDFFKRMDTDGNGYVCISEFMEFIPHKLFNYPYRMFKMFDKDGNGTLDFEEVVTFYYMLITGRMVFCDGCGNFLKGVYFTCCQCFHPSEDRSFDLCCTCFRGKNFKHHADAIFYDNFTLLRSNVLVEAQNQINSAETTTTTQVTQRGDALRYGIKALKISMDGLSGISDCNIM